MSAAPLHELIWTHRFDYPREEVWPLLSNTDRLNRAVGLPDVKYVEEPRPEGGSRRFATARKFGQTLRWEEHPFDWVEPEFHSVRRTFSNSPFKEMRLRLDLIPLPGGGCEARTTVHYIPRLGFLAPILRAILQAEARPAFFAGCRQAEKFLHDKLGTVSCPWEAWQPRGGDRFKWSTELRTAFETRLRELGTEPADANTVLSFVDRAQEPDLQKIRPFVFARHQGWEPGHGLSALLRATRAGVFQLSWDLLCPGCRGDKASAKTLRELKGEAHCNSCNLDFTADFARSVELTFRIDPSVRVVSDSRFCVGGPQNTPHVHAQRVLAPGETARIEVALAPGSYFLRSGQSRDREVIEVQAEGGESRPRRAAVSFGGRLSLEPPAALPPAQGPGGRWEIELTNTNSFPITATLERAQWMEDACTALQASTFQDFRDLFPTESLAQDLQLEVRSVALMFTDLKGSTALYQRVGDPRAYNLVRDHFEVLIDAVKANHGALIKTIGDAVMAAFADPGDAARAAIDIHRGIADLNESGGDREALTVKVGLHCGPCFAVNLNDRLDFFGGTVNLAARTEGQCTGADIVLSRTMAADPRVARALDEAGYPREPLTRELKGFSERFELVRVDCAELFTRTALAG